MVTHVLANVRPTGLEIGQVATVSRLLGLQQDMILRIVPLDGCQKDTGNASVLTWRRL